MGPTGFPVFFPSYQGIGALRDGFAHDCLLQRRVSSELGLPPFDPLTRIAWRDRYGEISFVQAIPRRSPSPRGTERSNPVPSSGESTANRTFIDHGCADACSPSKYSSLGSAHYERLGRPRRLRARAVPSRRAASIGPKHLDPRRERVPIGFDHLDQQVEERAGLGVVRLGKSQKFRC